MSGQVFLVGAGPGDPGLISQRALDVLALADVVLYDYLVHPNVLHHVVGAAELVCVGKKRGKHHQKQADINAMMVAYAHEGKCVVRLKGGTVTVFGRGGEEMDYLHEAGISFEIVPGVSSVFSVLESVGIPVTHRDLSRSVAVVSASSKRGGELDDVEIPQADTLIFVMGVKHLAAVMARVGETRAVTTPVAVIDHGTVAGERVVVGTIATIADELAKQGVQTPALIVVGQTVSLYQSKSIKPRLILPRPLGADRGLERRFIDAGYDVVNWPLLRAETIDIEYVFQDKTMLVLTSALAVRVMMIGVLVQGGDARWLAGLTVVVVGDKTNAALRSFGLVADVVAEQPSQEGVVAALPDDLSDQTVLFLGSKHARSYLVDVLRDRGATVTYVPIYEMVPMTPMAIEISPGDQVVLTSPMVAERFFEVFDGDVESLQYRVIGAQTGIFLDAKGLSYQRL